jgi:spermidine/putrescine-binding protein
MFETMDLLFLHAGYPSNSRSIAALDGARRSAQALAENAVRFGDTFENIEALRRGEVDIIQAYSGDVFSKAGHDPNIVFFLPEEGFSLWADYLVLSSGSRHVAEAHAFVEFLSRKDVSMRSARAFHYDSPMAETNELATRMLHGASRLLPPAEKRRQRARFEPAGPATGEYQKIFSELKRRSP